MLVPVPLLGRGLHADHRRHSGQRVLLPPPDGVDRMSLMYGSPRLRSVVLGSSIPAPVGEGQAGWWLMAHSCPAGPAALVGRKVGLWKEFQRAREAADQFVGATGEVYSIRLADAPAAGSSQCCAIRFSSAPRLVSSASCSPDPTCEWLVWQALAGGFQVAAQIHDIHQAASRRQAAAATTSLPRLVSRACCCAAASADIPWRCCCFRRAWKAAAARGPPGRLPGAC